MSNNESEDLFVKVPHWVNDYLESADMNMTQYRIFQVVLRQTFGFHQKSAPFSQSFLAKRTKCHQRQIVRELKELVQRKILLQFYDGGKRHLSINPALKKVASDQSQQIENAYDSLDTPDCDSSVIDGSDLLDTQLKKETKEKRSKEKYYIDFDEIDDPFINFYLNHYKKSMRRKHVKISEKSYEFIQNQISHLIEYGTTREEWEEKVIQFFKDPLKEGNNRSIRYFLELSHRYFEVHLYNQFNK